VRDSVRGDFTVKNHALSLRQPFETEDVQRLNILFRASANSTFTHLENVVKMLEKNFGLLFFLKKPNPFRKGPWLVFLRITVDGLSREMSLKRSWEPTRWSSKTGAAT
jgi:hypothetical protein